MKLSNFEKCCNDATNTSSEFEVIKSSFNFTQDKITQIKKHLESEIEKIQPLKSFCLVAVGSFGRHEASIESDLDVYMIYEDEGINSEKEKIKTIVVDTAEKKYQIKCSYSPPILLDTMCKHIGGKEDSNIFITNRVLFLLESVCLYNNDFYHTAYNKILKKYLKECENDTKKPPRFLLNDIIRYYRTICVDYEFKITEESKDWAIRNIKLRFSRKGLYFGAIIILLMSILKRRNKFKYIKEHLGLPFTEKISHIINEKKLKTNYLKILKIYGYFLEKISDNKTREHLKKLKKENRRTDKVFLQMTKKGHTFDEYLINLLNDAKWDANAIELLIL